VLTALTILVALIFAVLIFLAGQHLGDLFAARRLMLRRRVLVTLESGVSFSGVLWGKRGEYLVLKSAQMHDVGERAVPVDGELVIERGQVDYVQVLSAVGAG
jgi:hypothetical protein